MIPYENAKKRPMVFLPCWQCFRSGPTQGFRSRGEKEDQAKKVKKHKKAFEAEVDELDERQKHDIGQRELARGDVDGGMDP